MKLKFKETLLCYLTTIIVIVFIFQYYNCWYVFILLIVQIVLHYGVTILTISKYLYVMCTMFNVKLYLSQKMYLIS